MKFTCEREPIVREIANAYEIISFRNSLSVLSNVLLEVKDGLLTIRATDLKVNYESSIPGGHEKQRAALPFSVKSCTVYCVHCPRAK